MKERAKVTREAIESDHDLASLLFDAGEALGKQGLARLLTAQRRFNEPVYFLEEDSVDKFYKLKAVLKEIPGYVNLSEQAGLSHEQAEDTVAQLFDTCPFEFQDNGTTIFLIKRAFESMIDEKQTFNPDSYHALHSFIELCNTEGIIDGGFYGLSLLISQHVQPIPAMITIEHLVDEDGSLGGYTIGPFLDLVRATTRSGISPEILTKTLAAIAGKRPYYRQQVYVDVQETLAFGCPTAGATPSELLSAYFDPGNPEKDIIRFINNYLGNTENRLAEQTGPIIITDQDKEHYFVPAEGQLEHSAYPYRTKRNLIDGARDLTRLAAVDIGHWGNLSEGMFIFDPKTSVWYSLGGKSELAPARVIHNVIYYDLGQLSPEPSIFMVHPKGFESWITPSFEKGSILDAYRRQLGTFLGGTPGRGEYAYIAHSLQSATRRVDPKYYIVHSAGITQLHFPGDISQLEELSSTARQLRDEAVLSMDWQKLLRQYGYDADVTIVVSRLIKEFNKYLPRGCSMTYYPNADFLKPHLLSGLQD